MDWRVCGVVVVLVAGCADPDVLDDEDVRELLESGVEQADFGAVGAGTIASARAEHLAIMVGHPPVEPSAEGWWIFETRQYRYSTADGTVQREPDEATDVLEMRESFTFAAGFDVEVELRVTGLLGEERSVVGEGSQRIVAVEESTTVESTTSWTFDVHVGANGCTGELTAAAEITAKDGDVHDAADGEAIGRIDDETLSWWLVRGEDRIAQPMLVSRCVPL